MLKFLSEFIPLLSFIITYFYYGTIESATLYMLITSIIFISIYYITKHTIPNSILISSSTLLISASIALLTGNSMYIKIKPTILYLIFSTTFFISTIKNKSCLKYMFQHIVQLEDKYWNILSYRTSIFFLIMAITNELLWRNYSESTWVKFKIFGTIPITIFFTLLQIPLLLKKIPK